MITALADQICTLLNAAPAGTFTPPFVAVRLNVPIVELTDLDTLHVTVVPGGWDRKQVARANNYALRTRLIDVGIQQRFSADQLTTGGNAATDPLIALGEAIAEYLALQPIGQGGIVSEAQLATDLYERQHIDQLATFTQIVRLTIAGA